MCRWVSPEPDGTSWFVPDAMGAPGFDGRNT